MIVLSAVLVVAALLLLLVGLIASDGVLLIWMSIGASLMAGGLLLLGVMEQRRRILADSASAPETASPSSNVITTPGAPIGTGGEPGATTAPGARSDDVPETLDDAPTAMDDAPTAMDDAPTAMDDAPTAIDRVEERGSAPVVAVEPDADETTAAVTSVPVGDAEDPADIPPGDPLPLAAADVFVLPGRPRYHLSGCRFLASHDDMTGMLLADAEAKGYTACSVCRP